MAFLNAENSALYYDLGFIVGAMHLWLPKWAKLLQNQQFCFSIYNNYI